MLFQCEFIWIITCTINHDVVIEVLTPDIPICLVEIGLFPVTNIVDTFNVMVNDITRVMYNIGPFIGIVTWPSKIVYFG